MKEDYDGAEPSPTSVSAMNLLTLAHLTGERAYAIARTRRSRLRRPAREQGRAVPFMAAALSTAIAPAAQIVIVGPRDREDTRAMWRRAQRKFRPFAVIMPVDPARAGSARRAHAVGRRDDDDRRQGHGLCVRGLRVQRAVVGSGGAVVSGLVQRIDERDGPWRRLVLRCAPRQPAVAR